MEQTINEKIARALLMQCALVWEHCTKSATASTFNLSQVRQGVCGKTVNRQKSKPGLVDVDLEHPKWEGSFRLKLGQIDGVTLTPENYIRLEHGSFGCGYWLKDVFDVADRFCKNNIPWMGNKAEFGCDGDKRWANLPKQEEARPRQKAKVRSIRQTPELSLSERLRQAMLARLAA